MSASQDQRVTDPAPARAARGADGDPSGPVTLGHRLLQLRLLHRQERLRLVLVALRERARAADTGRGGHVPEPLAAAIAGFERELEVVRGELLTLGPAATRDPGDGP